MKRVVCGFNPPEKSRLGNLIIQNRLQKPTVRFWNHTAGCNKSLLLRSLSQRNSAVGAQLRAAATAYKNKNVEVEV